MGRFSLRFGSKKIHHYLMFVEKKNLMQYFINHNGPPFLRRWRITPADQGARFYRVIHIFKSGKFQFSVKSFSGTVHRIYVIYLTKHASGSKNTYAK